MVFVEKMQEESVHGPFNISYTENGMCGYKTTGKALLDLNFRVSSLRSADEDEVAQAIFSSLAEDFENTIIWLFFARDVRGIGMGERRLFRIGMRVLAKSSPDVANTLLDLIPIYGRWDDLIDIMFEAPGTWERGLEILRIQLYEDAVALSTANGRTSLLAKWMPSENTSSADTKYRASQLLKALGKTPREYRKLLSRLRERIDVVERKMSNGDWSDINYEAVPSKANLLYRNAFMEHDAERRGLYLESLKKGETKINARDLFPYEIVHSVLLSRCNDDDGTLQKLWEAQQDYIGTSSNTLVVADGSGSMHSFIDMRASQVTAWEVAHSLAIYFAEKIQGPFHNTYVTFSEHPSIVRFSEYASLIGKISQARQHSEAANTDIFAVFKLILKTAIENDMKQEDLPKNILILSDMEFDRMAVWNGNRNITEGDFEKMKRLYESYGYNLPRLVFWNVCSRTGTIPVLENKLGVALVSGFSPMISKMVLSEKTDPMEVLVESLGNERYTPVRLRLHKALLSMSET